MFLFISNTFLKKQISQSLSTHLNLISVLAKECHITHEIIYFSLGPSQMVITSAFLSQERECVCVNARNGRHLILRKKLYCRITSMRTSKEKQLQEFIIKFEGGNACLCVQYECAHVHVHTHI